MKRKVLSILLAAALIIGCCPALCFSTFAEGAAVQYNSWVGTVQITSDNASDVLGDGTVSYTPASGDECAVLTLNNANITASRSTSFSGYSITAVLDVQEPLKLVLSGSSYIGYRSSSIQESDFAGILSGNNDLEICGDGSLEIYAPESEKKNGLSAGIYCSGYYNSVYSGKGTLTVSGSASVAINVVGGSKYSYGVFVGAFTLRDSASLTAKSHYLQQSSYYSNPSESNGTVYCDCLYIYDNAHLEAGANDQFFALCFSSMYFYGGTVDAYSKKDALRSSMVSSLYVGVERMVALESDTETLKLQNPTREKTYDYALTNSYYYATNNHSKSVRLVSAYRTAVAGKSITAASMSDVLGDGTVTYTPASGDSCAVLTLNNASIESTVTGINTTEELEIVLSGSSFIGSNTIKDFTPVRSTADLTVSGSGSLTLNSDDVSVIKNANPVVFWTGVETAGAFTVCGDAELTVNAYYFGGDRSSIKASQITTADNAAVNINNRCTAGSALIVKGGETLNITDNSSVNVFSPRANQYALKADDENALVHIKDSGSLTVTTDGGITATNAFSVYDLLVEDNGSLNVNGNVPVNALLIKNSFLATDSAVVSAVNSYTAASSCGFFAEDGATALVDGNASCSFSGSYGANAPLTVNGGSVIAKGNIAAYKNLSAGELNDEAIIFSGDSEETSVLTDSDSITGTEKYIAEYVEPLIYVGNNLVYSVNKDDFRDTENWYLVPATAEHNAELHFDGTTLDEANTDLKTFVFSSAPLDVYICGGNLFTNLSHDSVSGFKVMGDLNIYSEYGVYGFSLEINTGCRAYSVGISAAGDFAVDKVNIDIYAGLSGIVADGDISINNSELFIRKNNDDPGETLISAHGDLDISGSYVGYTHNDGVTADFGVGVDAENISVSGSVLDIYGTLTPLCASGNLYVDDSSLYLVKPDGPNQALSVGGDVTVTDYGYLAVSDYYGGADNIDYPFLILGNVTVEDAEIDLYSSSALSGGTAACIEGDLTVRGASDEASFGLDACTSGLELLGDLTVDNAYFNVKSHGSAPVACGLSAQNISINGSSVFNVGAFGSAAGFKNGVMCASLTMTDAADSYNKISAVDCGLFCTGKIKLDGSKLDVTTASQSTSKTLAAVRAVDFESSGGSDLTVDCTGKGRALCITGSAVFGKGIYILKTTAGASLTPISVPAVTEGYGYLSYGMNTASYTFDSASSLSEYATVRFICGYGLYVDGVEISPDEVTEGANWSYDPETNTLELDGASLDSVNSLTQFDDDTLEYYFKGAPIANYAVSNLNIVLTGENTITVPDTLPADFAYSFIDSALPVTVSGSGSLDCTKGEGTAQPGKFIPLDCEDIYVEENAELNINTDGFENILANEASLRLYDNAAVTLTDNSDNTAWNVLLTGGTFTLECPDNTDKAASLNITGAAGYYPLYFTKAAESAAAVRVNPEGSLEGVSQLNIIGGYMPGDVATNNELDVYDYQAEVNAALGNTDFSDELQFYAGDLDFDGVIDALDCSALERMLSGNM